MFTILPLRLAASACWQKTCEHSHSPRRLTSVSRVHCSSVSSRNGTIVSMPALFTRMSSGPSSCQALSIMASTSTRLATSLDGDRAAPADANRLRRLLRLLGVCDIVHRDVGAFFRQSFGYPTADSAARARNQRDLSLKFHCLPFALAATSSRYVVSRSRVAAID